MSVTQKFLGARDLLLQLRSDYARACREFQWPDLDEFNWVRDYFDTIPLRNDRLALRVVDDTGADQARTFSQLSARSRQVARFLDLHGIGAGDRVLIMLGNMVPLWEVMLGVMRLGAVIIPATTQLQRDELRDRLERGEVKVIVTEGRLAERFAGLLSRQVCISVGEPVPGWLDFAAIEEVSSDFEPPVATRASALSFLYFTSGTTARPKLVGHTQQSYPVGSLSTLYWLGLQPGDVHLNLSSPGWAKHAWSSVFAPWNAEATVVAYNYERFQPHGLLDQLVRCRVTSLCAPPTVWRRLIQEPLRDWPVCLRELASAGEPLNPEVIDQVRSAWNLTIRDGFGQTETTAQIGNPPGQPLKIGSMGRPLPGYSVVLLSPDGEERDDGEICLDLRARRPLGLMEGYLDAPAWEAEASRDGYFHTGDVASRDADGYLTYVGRMDDVFKCSDYRISPFELESVLMAHPAVAEAAVVPSPDPLRLAIPKAHILLVEGHAADAATARSIFQFVRDRVAPYKRIRKLEFRDLPRTVSGKIRRSALRSEENAAVRAGERVPNEFLEEGFTPSDTPGQDSLR
jgi:acetyl-CoA synthetase